MGLGPFFLQETKPMLNNRVDTVELIRIVDAVANEKSIDKELVLTSMEEAIEKGCANTLWARK
jgi:N utilization substance protein A